MDTKLFGDPLLSYIGTLLDVRLVSQDWVSCRYTMPYFTLSGKTERGSEGGGSLINLAAQIFPIIL